MDLFTLIFQWVVVFLVNIIPAFAPPTWIVLAYFYITNPQNLLLLILIGVTASTAGRYALAKFSGKFFMKFASPEKKKEIELIRNKLQKRKKAKFLFSFLFAIGPLPTNAFFIAVGSTKTKLKEVMWGFFFGRLLSYLFLVYTSEKVFTAFEETLMGEAKIFTLVLEIIGVLLILAFFLVDWKKIIGLIDENPFSKKPKK